MKERGDLLLVPVQIAFAGVSQTPMNRDRAANSGEFAKAPPGTYCGYYYLLPPIETGKRRREYSRPLEL